MADFIPGINVGNAFKQIGSFFGLAPKGDYDVLDNFTNSGREGQANILPAALDVKSGDNLIGTQPVLNAPVSKPTPPPSNDSVADPQLAALQALEARKADKAGGIKNSLIGRGGEIDNLFNTIVGNIEALVADKKRSRQGQYDTDTATLIDSLNAAIPQIQKAFASLGLTSSTFVGDRVDDTNQEFEKSQESVDSQFDNDLASYGQWADSERSNANASAAKLRNSLDYVRGLDPTAENLSGLQESEQTFNNALTDFGANVNKYTTSGDAVEALNSVGADYDFSKILDSFGSLAASSANTGTGGGAAQRVQDSIRGLDPKNKKKLSEVQVNNPVGAAAS